MLLGVSYFHDISRATLVSHISFYRGWSSFRSLQAVNAVELCPWKTLCLFIASFECNLLSSASQPHSYRKHSTFRIRLTETWNGAPVCHYERPSRGKRRTSSGFAATEDALWTGYDYQEWMLPRHITTTSYRWMKKMRPLEMIGPGRTRLKRDVAGVRQRLLRDYGEWLFSIMCRHMLRGALKKHKKGTIPKAREERMRDRSFGYMVASARCSLF